MYKLIVLDLDGTLLNSKKEITERTLKALKMVKDKGVKIVLASARAFHRIKPYIEQIGLLDENQYTISFNGGCITNNTERNLT